MYKARSNFHRVPTQLNKGVSLERGNRIKNLQKQQQNKNNKDLQNFKTKSPLKKFLQLRLGKNYSAQLSQMVKLLEKEKKLKNILFNNQGTHKKAEIQSMIQFIKKQQQTLIYKVQTPEINTHQLNNYKSSTSSLKQLSQTITLKNNQSEQKLLCKTLKKVAQNQSKALKTIFQQLQQICMNDGQERFTNFKSIVSKLKQNVENNKKLKQRNNQLMKKVIQLQKSNVKLVKQYRKVEQEFQYLVEEKLNLQAKSAKSTIFIQNLQIKSVQKSSHVKNKLFQLHSSLQGLQLCQLLVKDDIKRIHQNLEEIVNQSLDQLHGKYLQQHNTQHYLYFNQISQLKQDNQNLKQRNIQLNSDNESIKIQLYKSKQNNQILKKNEQMQKSLLQSLKLAQIQAIDKIKQLECEIKQKEQMLKELKSQQQRKQCTYLKQLLQKQQQLAEQRNKDMENRNYIQFLKQIIEKLHLEIPNLIEKEVIIIIEKISQIQNSFKNKFDLNEKLMKVQQISKNLFRKSREQKDKLKENKKYYINNHSQTCIQSDLKINYQFQITIQPTKKIELLKQKLNNISLSMKQINEQLKLTVMELKDYKPLENISLQLIEQQLKVNLRYINVLQQILNEFISGSKQNIEVMISKLCPFYADKATYFYNKIGKNKQNSFKFELEQGNKENKVLLKNQIEVEGKFEKVQEDSMSLTADQFNFDIGGFNILEESSINDEVALLKIELSRCFTENQSLKSQIKQIKQVKANEERIFDF